jgi:hypothetical protein
MRVFISYPASDEQLAREVNNTFERNGLQGWGDFKTEGGESWYYAHQRELLRSDFMVVFIGESSVDDPKMANDISFALGNSRFKNKIIPVIKSFSDVKFVSSTSWILTRMNIIIIESHLSKEDAFSKIADRINKSRD